MNSYAINAITRHLARLEGGLLERDYGENRDDLADIPILRDQQYGLRVQA